METNTQEIKRSCLKSISICHFDCNGEILFIENQLYRFFASAQNDS